MGWDGDRAGASDAARGSASRGTSVRESDYSWLPSRMLPMLPNARTEKYVSCPSFRQVRFAFCRVENLLGFDLGAFLLLPLKCTHLVPAKAPLPEVAIFNQNQAAAEKRRAARKVQHKKCQIAKRDRNDDCNKRRKAGELGVSSDEDPSPEPSWSGDVASAAVDWSNMSGSSSSSPLHGAEVSSSRRPREAGATRSWGRAHVRRLPLPEWAFGRHAPVQRPTGRALPSHQDLRPVRSIPLGGQRSVRCLSASSTTVRIARTLTPCRGAGHRGRSLDSTSTPSAAPVAKPSAAPRRLRSLLIQGGRAPDVHVPLIAGGGHGPTPAVAEAGETAPERMGENVSAVEAADRSREAPEMADSRRAVPEQGRSSPPLGRACRIAR
jgi:hypothetical protein